MIESFSANEPPRSPGGCNPWAWKQQYRDIRHRPDVVIRSVATLASTERKPPLSVPLESKKEPDMSKRLRPWFLVAAILTTVGAIHLLTLRPGHDWGGDFSLYVHHAKNLAEGTPYAETGYLYNPAYATIGPPTYPPVLPLILAPVYLVCGLNFEAMKLVMVASLVAFLLFVFLSFRRELPLGHALAIVVLVGLSRTLLGGANSIGSDMPFMAILYLTIFTLQKAYDTYRNRRPRFRYLVPAVVLICVAFSTRTLGGVLLPSVLVYDLLRYRRITGWAVAVGAAVAAFVLVQSVFVHSNSAYFDQYNVGPSVFVHNGIGYMSELAAFWHNGYFKPLGGLVFVAVTALAVLGYASSVRRRVTLFDGSPVVSRPGVTILEVFPPLYLAAVLLFPSFGGRRFLEPIFPLYLFFAFRGLEHAWLVRRERVRRVVFASLLVAVGGSYLASATRLDLDVTEGIGKAESVALFDYVRHETPEDGVVIFIKPRVMSLLTSRRASAYHMPSDPSQLWDYFSRIGATHLVVVENDDAFFGAEDPARLAYLRTFAEGNPAKLRPVFANADFRVYRIADQEAGLATAVSEAEEEPDRQSSVVLATATSPSR